MNNKNIKKGEQGTPLSIKEILEDCGWENGYGFRSSEYFFLNNLKVSKSKEDINLCFDLEYKTKAHRVVNHVQWVYNIYNIAALWSDIEKLELDIMLKTSDPDRTDQVFGKRFNKELFKSMNYGEKGWVVKK